jgi:hypothetical protein
MLDARLWMKSTWQSVIGINRWEKMAYVMYAGIVVVYVILIKSILKLV